MPKPQPSDKGFTIIETLIVLAIAGLILLIVFLAIPTLQRNSRNNQRKQDVQAVLEAVSHFELNNTGAFPGPADNYLQYTQSKLTYYTGAGQITVHPQSTSTTVNQTPHSNLDQLDVYNYEKCDANGDGGATVQGAGYNDVVALYAIETGSSSTSGQCLEL